MKLSSYLPHGHCNLIWVNYAYTVPAKFNILQSVDWSAAESSPQWRHGFLLVVKHLSNAKNYMLSWFRKLFSLCDHFLKMYIFCSNKWAWCWDPKPESVQRWTNTLSVLVISWDLLSTFSLPSSSSLSTNKRKDSIWVSRWHVDHNLGLCCWSSFLYNRSTGEHWRNLQLHLLLQQLCGDRGAVWWTPQCVDHRLQWQLHHEQGAGRSCSDWYARYFI